MALNRGVLNVNAPVALNDCVTVAPGNPVPAVGTAVTVYPLAPTAGVAAVAVKLPVKELSAPVSAPSTGATGAAPKLQASVAGLVTVISVSQ